MPFPDTAEKHRFQITPNETDSHLLLAYAERAFYAEVALKNAEAQVARLSLTEGQASPPDSLLSFWRDSCVHWRESYATWSALQTDKQVEIDRAMRRAHGQAPAQASHNHG